MAQQLLQNRPREIWKSSTLPGQVVGDLFAAAISSTLITPVLTAIDRLVGTKEYGFRRTCELPKAS